MWKSALRPFRQHPAITTAAVVSIGLIWLVYSTRTFQECVSEYTHGNHANQLQEHVEAIYWCGSEFLETYAETIIAVFTIILGIGTIGLAIATHRLAIGAEINAERQLRAYINLTRADVIGFDESETSARAILKNFGQTPAYQVAFKIGVVVVDRPFSGTPDFDKPDQQSAGVLGPESDVKCVVPFQPPLPKEIKAAILVGEKAMLIYGRVDYVDTFGHPRWTTFTGIFEARDAATSDASFAVWKDGNDAN